VIGCGVVAPNRIVFFISPDRVVCPGWDELITGYRVRKKKETDARARGTRIAFVRMQEKGKILNCPEKGRHLESQMPLP
jgi:hypothetical protein